MNLEEIYKDGKKIYPPKYHVFRAMELCPLDKVKVVILGQDPYHGPGQANGLAFSVNKGITLPPSLRNIFKELESDLRIKNTYGDLTSWAKQGVLLLNTVLTVEEGKPGSHYDIGWEKYTDNIIRHLNKKEDIIFVLWGSKAKAKKLLIDEEKHYILESAHPSPLSCQGFFGCRHFSKINDILVSINKKIINWRNE